MISALKIFRNSYISVNVPGYRQLAMSHFVDKVKFQPDVYESKRFEDLFYKRIKLVSPDRINVWRDHFPEIVEDVLTHCDQNFEIENGTSDWVRDVMNYNTPYGKGIRAFQVILADEYLCNDTSPENVLTINKLAWLMELMQGAACVGDDIMDESETRRDRLCWHKVNNQGMAAFNDGLLLLCASSIIMNKYFSNAPYFEQLLELCSVVVQTGVYGESRDVRNAKLKNYHRYNLEIYKNMMMFKNGYYTFYAPVATAMLKNDIKDDASLKEVEKLSLDIGLIYSIQDDYMDCFVDPKLTGKIGTDIEEGKCTWLFVNALEKCSASERQMLLENYGSRDEAKVNTIKGLYHDVEIPELYKQWEEETFTTTVTKIGQLSITRLQPLFYDLLATLCGRVR